MRRVRQGGGDVERGKRNVVSPGEPQHVADDRAGLPRARQDQGRVSGRGALRRGVFKQELGGADDRLKQVVDFMGEPAGQLRERREPLLARPQAAQLLFEGLRAPALGTGARP